MRWSNWVLGTNAQASGVKLCSGLLAILRPSSQALASEVRQALRWPVLESRLRVLHGAKPSAALAEAVVAQASDNHLMLLWLGLESEPAIICTPWAVSVSVTGVAIGGVKIRHRVLLGADHTMLCSLTEDATLASPLNAQARTGVCAVLAGPVHVRGNAWCTSLHTAWWRSCMLITVAEMCLVCAVCLACLWTKGLAQSWVNRR